MREKDSFETKVIRVSIPLLIYYGVRLLVEVVVGIVASVFAFLDMGKDGSVEYTQTYRLMDNTEVYLQKYSLVVLFVAAAISILILWKMFVKDERERNRKVQIKDAFYGKDLALILLMGVCSASGIAKLVNMLPLDNIIGSYEQVNDNFMSNPLLFQILTLCIAAPVVEELIYRAMIYQRLKDYLDISVSVIVSALIFGMVHGNLLQGLYAGILGILLCYVYERYDSFFAPVLLHMAANTTALVMEYLPLSTWISERPFVRALVMLVELALLGGCLYRMRRGRDA